MAFSEEVKRLAFGHAGGRCECTQPEHGHAGRCNKSLTLFSAHFRPVVTPIPGSAASMSGCEVLCAACHAAIEAASATPPASAPPTPADR